MCAREKTYTSLGGKKKVSGLIALPGSFTRKARDAITLAHSIKSILMGRKIMAPISRVSSHYLISSGP